MNEAQQETKRTVLPPAEAEGAANFAAEPGMDPTAGPNPDQDMSVANRSETGTLTQPQNTTPAGEEGNRTGGEPPEDIIARRAESEADEAGDQQALNEAYADRQAGNPEL